MSLIQLSSTVMERFGEEDDLALLAPENQSSSPFKRKLKRLKKAAVDSLHQPLPISPSFTETSEVRRGLSDAMENGSLGEETEFDPLFGYRSEGILLEVDEIGGGNDEKEVVGEEFEKEKNVKRKLSLEDGEDDLNGAKKRKGKSGKPKESVRERNRFEKARKAELEDLHAESQRLLRETRDASFKPVQLIQKPISSVLEKIRLRKLEILKSCNIVSSLSSVVDVDCAVGSDIKETVMNANAVFDVDSNSTDKNLSNYTQADESGDRLSAGVDNLLKAQEVSPPAAQPTSNLEIDNGGDDDGDASSSDYEVSSSEEENDKENISPSFCNVVNKDSSPKDDLAKAFLDDEAEEEDDSDCDLLRFQENEEENESDEHEELGDLIATGYKEAPIDQEKRKQLHQKWLELQDAAETDNVLQRLKSGHQGIGKPALNHDDYDNYDESDNDDDEGNDGDDEVLHKNHSNETSRQSLKKAKQMISHMFTDANDVYIASDDEETEKNIFRHHILKHNQEPSLISPVEDENSREFFSLIKKLNIAPTTKKRGKVSAPALLDSLVFSGGSSNSSKSSFLNRTSNSLPSSHKQGSISVKTFIFGRDDSNSRSNISASEINSEMAEKESISAKNSKKDKLSSEVKSSIIIKKKMQRDSEASTGSSLFDILRQSSIQFDKQLLESSHSASGSTVIAESQVAYKFSAFKLRKNSKMGSRT